MGLRVWGYLSVAAIVISVGGCLIFLKYNPEWIRKPKLVVLNGLNQNTNLLFSLKGDLSGRGVYYTNNDGSQTMKYSGVGLIYQDKTKQRIAYMVGSINRWESIPNSKDKYLFLKDNLNTLDVSGMPLVYPKIRVGFLGGIGLDGFSTAIGVEDLNSKIPFTLDKAKGVKLYRLGTMANFSVQEFETLFKKDDAVAIAVVYDPQKNADKVDDNGAKYAGWLFIRRYDPKNKLAKELGRVVYLHE